MVGKILIVDDVATNRIVMKVKLGAAGYHPLVAPDGATCLRMAGAEVVDLILLDLHLPDISGIEVLARLRANPQTRTIPVVMFSASQAPDARVRAFQSGADDFLIKPIDDQTMLARIRGLLRSRSAVAGMVDGHPDGLSVLGLAEPAAAFEVPGRVVLVVAQAETALLMRRDLIARTRHHVTVLTKDAALAQDQQQHDAADVFVIEADLAGQGDGLRLMSELNSRSNTRNAGFSVLVRPKSQTTMAVAYDLGANDVITDVTPPEELALRIERLVRRKRESDRARATVQDGLRLAMIDPLTGLHNRRYGIAQLSQISEQAHKTGSDFAVLVVDIDRFKSVNDRWGHTAGDAVLIEVASRLQQNLRQSDLLARIGGEEFLIALPEISLPEARRIAERLCAAMEELPIETADGQALGVTVSIGLAISEGGARPQQIETVSEIFDRADRALMRSKSDGRNKVTLGRRAA